MSHSGQARGVYALGDQVVYSFGNMVVAALLSRRCTLLVFGIYILTQRAMDVLIQLSNGLLWTPFTFGLPGLARETRASYQGSIVLGQTGFCIVFSGLLWSLSAVTASPRSASLHATFQPMVIPSAAILFREFTRRLYFADLRLKEAFWTDVVTVALQVLGVSWLAHTKRLNVESALAVLSAAAATVACWWIAREWNAWCVEPRSALADLRRDFRMGRWLFGANMLALISAQANPWFLEGMLGSASVGIYSIAESLVNIPRAALTSFQNLMGPTIAEVHYQQGRAGVREAVGTLDRRLWAASCLFALMVTAGAPLAAKAIYGHVLSGTRLLASLLAVSLTVFAGSLAQSYGLVAMGRADGSFFANLGGVLVQLMVSVLLVRRFQIPGAALALLVGNATVLGIRQWFFTNETTANRAAPPCEGAAQTFTA